MVIVTDRTRWCRGLVLVGLALSIWSCRSDEPSPAATVGKDAATSGDQTAGADDASRVAVSDDPREKHIRNIRQLTFGGTNAEAYFSNDGTRLIFQTTRPPYGCDQIFTMGIDGSNQHLVSTGRGRTTCAYFLPGDRRILYASTHLAMDDCPPPPDRSEGYVWALYDSYDIFTALPDGSDLQRLTTTPGYDAEATVAPDGTSIVFTSMRDGDLELYTMNLDGSNVRRLTAQEGYDGGAFFSPDSSKICYRARHPEGADLKRYRDLLKRNLVAPDKVDLFVMDRDGGNRKQLTANESANFCPYFHPSGKKLIFASNLGDETRRSFDLWLINTDGTGLEQVTFDPGYDFFPMFSPDGKKVVFCSSRGAASDYELNVFIADWVD